MQVYKKLEEWISQNNGRALSVTTTGGTFGVTLKDENGKSGIGISENFREAIQQSLDSLGEPKL